MITQADKAREFLALHRAGEPLLLPNPWDLGSARLLASLGFKALATTSSGFAATLGRNDGGVSRDEALIHAAVIVAATDLPVSADLENGYADEPHGRRRDHRAGGRGWPGGRLGRGLHRPRRGPHLPGEGRGRTRRGGGRDGPRGPGPSVLTARAENFLHGRPDLVDTIARLQAYQEAGADVLYAPGLRDIEDIRQVIREVDRPVNVLVFEGVPSVPEHSPRQASAGYIGRRLLRVRRAERASPARPRKLVGPGHLRLPWPPRRGRQAAAAGRAFS